MEIIITGKNTRIPRKTSLPATLLTIDPSRTNLGLNSGCHGERPLTNRNIYGINQNSELLLSFLVQPVST